MAYGETFKVGDRIAFKNVTGLGAVETVNGYSLGTVKAIYAPGKYEIEWDDGFKDGVNGLGQPFTYGSDEITHIANAVEVA